MNHTEYMRVYMAEHPEQREKARARSRAWRDRNRDAHRAYQRSYHKANPAQGPAWKAANPERIRGYRLRHAYGITEADFWAMVEAQGGGCAICRTPNDLVADHDHGTGCWRSVLCRGCNVSLSYLERGMRSRILKNPDQLARAQAITGKEY